MFLHPIRGLDSYIVNAGMFIVWVAPIIGIVFLHAALYGEHGIIAACASDIDEWPVSFLEYSVRKIVYNETLHRW